MSRIAILHPQCVCPGGAIQMALQACHVLQQQGHEVTLYTFEKTDTCFPDLQDGIVIQKWGKKTRNKLSNIITLAFHLRHFDIIIANNPPMQIVAALAKAFSLKIKYKGRKGRNEENEGMTEHNKKKIHNYSLFIIHYSLSSLTTIWWHHHVPWYLSKKMTNDEGIMKNGGLFISIKRFFEKNFVIPFIDQMIATSHFVAEKIREYCGRDSVVVHPVIKMNNEENEKMKKGVETIQFPPFRHSVIPSSDRVTLFTHGRLEAGKGIDVLVKIFRAMKNEKGIMKNKETVSDSPLQISPEIGEGAGGVRLVIFGTGSMKKSLREQGIDVQPFEGQKTFSELSTGEYGHVIGVYCSSIDAFGMASLESQMAGFSTIIMDRGGAREAILSDDDNQPVGHLVHSEEELLSTISRYVQNKILEKQMSNVNFSHKRDYFSPQRLYRDLLSIITKIGS